MADKIVLANISNQQALTSSAAAINSNNAIITTAIDNTLSRDGTVPNQMLSTLDMNSNRILNLPAPGSLNDPARLVDILSPNVNLTFTPAGANGSVQFNNNGLVGGFGIWNTGTNNLTFVGSISLQGSTSGLVTIGVPAAAGSTTFTLPGNNGSVGQPLTTNGSGITSWGNSVSLYGLTSGSVTVGVPTVAGTSTLFTLPSTSGTVGQVLTTDGSGNTSWVNTLNNGTQTANLPVLSLAQTWNNGAVSTFTAFQVQVTATAGTGSIVDFRTTAGGSIFSIQPNGTALFNSLVGNVGTNFWISDGNHQFYQAAFNGIQWSASGNAQANTGALVLCANVTTNGILNVVGSAANNTFGNAPASVHVYNSSDTNTLAVNNPTNFERGIFDWTKTSNVLTIGTAKGGTGATRNIQFIAGNTNILDWGITAGSSWTFTSGVFLTNGTSITFLGGGSQILGPDSGTWGSAGMLAVAGLGYRTGAGAGGTVTQITSKATGVTLNKAAGQITMNNAALAASTTVTFVLSNTTIAAIDVVNVSIASGATVGAYIIGVDATAANSCTISVRNITAGSLSEAIVLNYVVIKGAIT